MTGTDHVMEAAGLRKRYGDNQALDGLDLQVRRGTVLGLLGPNGAGKTTTVRVLATSPGPTAAPHASGAATSSPTPAVPGAGSAWPGSTPPWTRS
jgi:ABC-type branched-subunit amino acid transport system ATPase component